MNRPPDSAQAEMKPKRPGDCSDAQESNPAGMEEIVKRKTFDDAERQIREVITSNLKGKGWVPLARIEQWLKADQNAKDALNVIKTKYKQLKDFAKASSLVTMKQKQKELQVKLREDLQAASASLTAAEKDEAAGTGRGCKDSNTRPAQNMVAPARAKVPSHTNITARAIVSKVAMNRNGLLIGFCQLDFTKPRLAGKDQYFFHGTAADAGFKCGGELGVVECAGLELQKGDQLSLVEITMSHEQDWKVVRASLCSVLPDKHRFEDYLRGLAKALDNKSKRDSAMSCLCQLPASTAIWNCVSEVILDLTGLKLIISVLALLARHARQSGPAVGRTAKRALHIVFSSNISLPPKSLLGRVMGRDKISTDEREVRGFLVKVLCEVEIVQSIPSLSLFCSFMLHFEINDFFEHCRSGCLAIGTCIGAFFSSSANWSAIIQTML